MIVRFERIGKALSPPIYEEVPPINENTRLYHDIIVRVSLYDGESVWITFGNKKGNGFIASTKPFPADVRNYGIDDTTKKEYFCRIPNAFMEKKGQFACSIAILERITGTERYGQITSGIITFEVIDSMATTDYEPLDENVAFILNERIKNVSVLVAHGEVPARGVLQLVQNDGIKQVPLILGDGVETTVLIKGFWADNFPASVWKASIEGETVNEEFMPNHYYYTIPADTHGQIKDGATYKDLKVTFKRINENGEAIQSNADICTVKPNGDIYIQINRPANFYIKVENGLGIKGENGDIEGAGTKITVDGVVQDTWEAEVKADKYYTTLEKTMNLSEIQIGDNLRGKRLTFDITVTPDLTVESYAIYINGGTLRLAVFDFMFAFSPGMIFYAGYGGANEWRVEYYDIPNDIDYIVTNIIGNIDSELFKATTYPSEASITVDPEYNYKNKADKSKGGTLTLNTSDWNELAAAKTVADLTNGDIIKVAPQSREDATAWAEANIWAAHNGSTLTFTAETVPTDSITVIYEISKGVLA